MNCSDLYTETKQKNTNLLRNWSETIAYLKLFFLKWSWKSEADSLCTMYGRPRVRIEA